MRRKIAVNITSEDVTEAMKKFQESGKEITKLPPELTARRRLPYKGEDVFRCQDESFLR